MKILRNIIKCVLVNTVFRTGTTRTIFWGPCKGLRYRIFPEYGHAPLLGGWEREAQRLMVAHLAPGMTAYDVGGNYGIHTLLLARLAGKKGHVYSFEPMVDIFQHLEENVQLNNFSNVTCLRMALSNQTGLADFIQGHHAGAGHLASVSPAQGTKISVPTTTLDEFVFKGGNRPPDFIKIDVEGAESRVLSGGTRVIKENRPIILIDLHNPKF